MIYVFNSVEKLVAILSNDSPKACPHYDVEYLEKLNGEVAFDFSVPASHDDSQYLVEENLVAFKDQDGAFQLFIIRQVEEEHNENHEKRAYCEPAWVELLDEIVKDKRPTNVTAALAIDDALLGSRWQRGTVDNLGTNSTNFYYESSLSSLNKVANVWKGELRFRVVISGNVITGRYVDLLTQRGSVTGKRFEYTKDIKSIKRKVDSSNVKTALYGRGKGEETGDGYGRRITFTDVVWTYPTHPTNKPAGQEWVGDTVALANFGRDYGTRHRYGVLEDGEETDPVNLLWKTWEALLKTNTPLVQYDLNVIALEYLTGYDHEKVRLGDTVIVIDREFKPALTVTARVIEIKRILGEPENTQIKLGNFMPTFVDETSRIATVEQKLDFRQGIWDDKLGGVDGSIPTSWLEGEIDTLQNQVNAGTGTVKITENDGVIITDTEVNPTRAIRLLGGIVAIANSKDGQGNWNWRTFGTGDGFTADELNAGKILTNLVRIEGDAKFYWDDQNLFIIDPTNSNKQIRLGKYDGMNYGIAFTLDGGTNWTTAITHQGVNATAIKTGALNASVVRIETADGSVVIDGTGVVCSNTSFRLKDDVTQLESVIRENNNMINDHSFEMVSTTGSADAYQTFALNTAHPSYGNYFWWQASNPANARILSTYNTDAPQMARFDYQAIELRHYNVNRWYTYVELDQVAGLTGSYTFSAHFASYDATTVNTTAYLELYACDLDGVRIQGIGNGSTSLLTMEKWKWKRVSRTVSNLPANTALIQVNLWCSVDARVLCDGVQAVPYSKPLVYAPESSLWRTLRGLAGYELVSPAIIGNPWVKNDLAVDGQVNSGSLYTGTANMGYARVRAGGGNEGGEMLLEGSGSYQDWALDVYLNQFRIHSNGTTYFRIQGSNEIIIYPPNQRGKAIVFDDSGVGGGGTEPTLRPDSNDFGFLGTPSYLWFKAYAGAFLTSSDRNKKRNIRTANKSDAYEKVKNLPVYEYDLVNATEEQRVKGYGVMADEAPSEIVDESGVAINLYNYVSLLLNAVKELQTKVEDLEGRVPENQPL